MNYKYVIGIDEAGRGPLAGPVAIGAVLFSKNEYKKFKLRLNGKFKLESNILKDSKKLSVNKDKCLILLDGALKAPSIFLNQKTIIKGDEKEPIISLASIAAKVKRDRKMTSLSKKYFEYNFEKHKGYGVKAH